MQNIKAEERLKLARDSLQTWGHDDDCRIYKNMRFRGPCDCGLEYTIDELIEAARDAGRKEIYI